MAYWVDCPASSSEAEVSNNATVIGVLHPKWGERPAVAVQARGQHPSEPDILAAFDGKVRKRALRERLSICCAEGP